MAESAILEQDSDYLHMHVGCIVTTSNHGCHQIQKNWNPENFQGKILFLLTSSGLASHLAAMMCRCYSLTWYPPWVSVFSKMHLIAFYCVWFRDSTVTQALEGWHKSHAYNEFSGRVAISTERALNLGDTPWNKMMFFTFQWDSLINIY